MKKFFTLLALTAAAFSAQASHSIYIQNLTEWSDVKLYAWATDADQIMGEWPGAAATSTETINGVNFLKFVTPDTADGTTYNFIVNDGKYENALQVDLATLTLDKDYYYATNGTKVAEVDPQNPGNVEFTDAEYTIYVDDQSGWNQLNIYAWSTGNPELFGTWPGYQTPGTITISGTTYKTYPMTDSTAKYNLIFNDGTNQFNGPTISIDRDYYFKVTSSNYEELPNPNATIYHIYIENKTGWKNFYVYSWNEYKNEIFGSWPGSTSATTQTIDGIEYLVFSYEGVENGTANLIFHNNDGTQYDAATISLNSDHYFTAYSDNYTTGVEAITAADNNATVEYYNLQGVRVSNPTTGLYIRRQGSSIEKIMVK